MAQRNPHKPATASPTLDTRTEHRDKLRLVLAKLEADYLVCAPQYSAAIAGRLQELLSELATFDDIDRPMSKVDMLELRRRDRLAAAQLEDAGIE